MSSDFGARRSIHSKLVSSPHFGGTLGSKRQTMGEEPSKIHRLESGNIPFRNMQNTITGLENAFAGPGWPWKPHKSKEQIFYIEVIPKFFSQLRFIIIFRDRKTF